MAFSWYRQFCGRIFFFQKKEMKAPISKEAVCISWPKLVIGNCLFNEYHCTWNILHPACLNKRLIIMCDVIIITISLSANWFYKQRILISWFDQAGNGRRSARRGAEGRGAEQRQSFSEPGLLSEWRGKLAADAQITTVKEHSLWLYTNTVFE